MPAPKYSEETLNEAARLREEGWSYARIGRRLGMSVGAVYWQCLKLGADKPDAGLLPARAPGPAQVTRSGHLVRRFSEEEDRVIREMSERGVPASIIARKLGRRHQSVLGRLMTLARHDARQEP